MRAAIVIAICLAAVGCRKPVDAPAENGPREVIEVEAEGVRGVIFPAEATGRDIGWPDGKRWTPGVDEVLRADAIARECVKDEAPDVLERYDEYARQYVGYVDGDRRLIFINYFFQRPDFEYWKEKLVRVKDGGINFFEVRVDIETSTCVQMYVHGEA
jgi:hypothetical protein